MNKHIKFAIGAVAFVIGGLIAQSKTEDGLDELGKFFSKKKHPEPESEDASEDDNK